MADTKTSLLSTLLGAGVASGDLIPIDDISASLLKAISVAELATAITTLGSLATDVEVASAISALSATYQPLDSDLTSIAALSTTSFGRGVLILADAAALRTAAGLVIGTDVEAHDTDLTTIAGLSPSNDDFLQRKAGAWANRTVAQVLTDLGLAALYQPLDSDLTAIAALSPSNDDVVQRKAGAWVNRSIAQLLTDLGIAANYQPLDSDLTAIAALTTTATGRSLLAANDAAALRTILALGTMATAAAADYLPLLAAGAAVENIGAVESNVNTVSATGSTETLDLAVYGVHDCTMDQNCTFTFSNPAPSGKNTTFVLILRGAFTATLPASVKWSSGSVPTYTTPSVYVLTTVDAGTTYYATQTGKAFA